MKGRAGRKILPLPMIFWGPCIPGRVILFMAHRGRRPEAGLEMRYNTFKQLLFVA